MAAVLSGVETCPSGRTLRNGLRPVPHQAARPHPIGSHRAAGGPGSRVAHHDPQCAPARPLLEPNRVARRPGRARRLAADDRL